jgi:hypothetical protein
VGHFDRQSAFVFAGVASLVQKLIQGIQHTVLLGTDHRLSLASSVS